MSTPAPTVPARIAALDARRVSWMAVALCLLLAASSACRRTGCELAGEPERVLDLRRSADREHLAQDVATVRSVADAYGDEAARAPVESNSPAAQRALPRRGPKATQYCESLLLDRIAAVHHVTPAELRTLVH